MGRIALVSTTLKNAVAARTLWESIPDFKMGSISLYDFIALHDTADALAKEYANKNAELTGVKDNRDEKAVQLNDLITRFRSGIRAAFGPDSTQYARSGGTRMRDRKPPRARAKPVSA